MSIIRAAARPLRHWVEPTTGFTVPNLPTDPSLAGGLFSMSLSSLSQLGRLSSNPQYQDPLVIDPKVNFTKVIGRHSLKTGFEYQLSIRR